MLNPNTDTATAPDHADGSATMFPGAIDLPRLLVEFVAAAPVEQHDAMLATIARAVPPTIARAVRFRVEHAIDHDPAHLVVRLANTLAELIADTQGEEQARVMDAVDERLPAGVRVLVFEQAQYLDRPERAEGAAASTPGNTAPFDLAASVSSLVGERFDLPVSLASLVADAPAEERAAMLATIDHERPGHAAQLHELVADRVAGEQDARS